jgi:hypothetical protein
MGVNSAFTDVLHSNCQFYFKKQTAKHMNYPALNSPDLLRGASESAAAQEVWLCLIG